MTGPVLPQIELTGSSVKLQPEQVLTHALVEYHTGVRKELEARILSAPSDFGADVLASILMEIASGHLNPFRITAGVAFRLAAQEARDGAQLPATMRDVAQEADDAAMNLGAYLAAQDSNAVMEGYHGLVNAKLPPKEAARRSARAFGLTAPQVRTAARMTADDAVASSRPGAYVSKIEAFIKRSFKSRIASVVAESIRQIRMDAIQHAWEDALADGSIPETAQKCWFTAQDERTCPICAPMDKVMVGIPERFILPDGNKVKMPPVHVRCRCTVELIYDEEEVSKSVEFEHEHPRGSGGRFGVKIKEREAEARANVDRLLAAMPDLQVGHGPRVSTLNPIAGVMMAGPSLTEIRVSAGPRVAAGPIITAGPNIVTPNLVNTLAPNVVEVRTHAVLGGQMVNLDRLGLGGRAGQLQRAAQITENAVHQDRKMPDGVEPMGKHMVAFAPASEIEAQTYNRMAHEASGFAQIDQPLRFVDRNHHVDVREQLDGAMEALDNRFRESDGVRTNLAHMEGAADHGIVEAAADLRREILAGPPPKGDVLINIVPEDCSLAWRYLLADRGAGFPNRYAIEAYDERTGRTLGKTEVSAATVASMTKVSSSDRDLPRVIVAPHGTWETGSAHGTTLPAADNPNHLEVVGAFHWRIEHGITILTPDPDVYGRANPEN